MHYTGKNGYAKFMQPIIQYSPHHSTSLSSDAALSFLHFTSDTTISTLQHFHHSLQNKHQLYILANHAPCVIISTQNLIFHFEYQITEIAKRLLTSPVKVLKTGEPGNMKL